MDSTRETVATETPDCRATSRMVTIFTALFKIAVAHGHPRLRILSARGTGLRESCHRNENGYIHFVNEYDPDRYLDVRGNDVPEARRVN